MSNTRRRPRTLEIAAAASVVFHAGALWMFSGASPQPSSAADLHEVTFMDVTYRPEVAKVLPKLNPGGGGASQNAPVPTYASGIAADDVPALDLEASLDRNPSQAKIDLDRYELDREGGMDVIRLGGEGSDMSTDEILAQPKVQLARGLDRSSGPGAPGLRGYPGVRQPESQIRIEHRPLAKPAARTLPELPSRDLPQVTAAPTKGTNFMIAGPISQREVVRKSVPRYPKWALERRISGTVVVRLWVLPCGSVKGVPTVETSSGYPDLDQVVVNALRGWEFAPLGPEVKSEDQWGIITFRFTLS